MSKGSRGAHGNHRDSRDRVPVRLLLSEFVHVVVRMELRRSRTSQASLLLTSPTNFARWPSSIVERSTFHTLSSHVRHARSFQSAVQIFCAASSPAARIGADLGPSHTAMDPNEEAGTAASPDHIIARLQTLEAADKVRNASDSPVVINVRSGVVHLAVGDPSNQRSGRPVTVCASGV